MLCLPYRICLFGILKVLFNDINDMHVYKTLNPEYTVVFSLGSM